MTLEEAMDPAQAFMKEAMACNQSMDAAMARGDSVIQQFYSDTKVFVTGGTGFLGKQFIEKLLRATTVSNVFVLLRPKKEKTIYERLKVMLQDPVYDKIREQQPSFADRIIPIAGDVTELRLGMSNSDWDILTDQVNLIFHMAATTRFDTPLRATIIINVRGTREALLLGKACKNLKSYVHVSTAFSHAYTNRVNSVLEDVYPSPAPPETMIQLVESVEEARLDDITPGLIKHFINVYTFSKAIAEEMVRKMSDDLSICIVRPAIVIHSIREPHPGWIDGSNIYGASGIVLGGYMGLLQTMICDDKAGTNLIPVDYVNNAIIAAGWDTAKRRTAGESNLKIYTVNTTPRNSLEMGHLIAIIRNDMIANYPTPMAMAYSLILKTNKPVIFKVYTWLLHLIPAYIVDGACLLLGKKRRFVKLYTNLNKLMKILPDCMSNNFPFIDKNTEALYESLSKVDREIFDFDVNKIDWRNYIVLWGLAFRKYVLKDGLTRTEYAKKKLFCLKIATHAAYMSYFYLLYKVFSVLFRLRVF